ncbi:MAG TPA: tetratricopeptide repeat protein [Planctomicrobium sp.]|nr:tetratricopeptide repeat protein [Planctomicrobium sp.]
MSVRLNSEHLVPVTWKPSALLRRYRLGLLAGGILWVLVASTFCGCGKSHGWVMNQSGRAYYRQGNYVAARGEFERALMDNPYRASYAYNVARSMEAQGDTAGAEELYQHALTLNPQHRPSYNALSTLLVNQGRSDDARQLLSAWSFTQPYAAAANVELAQVEKSDGNLAGAEQQLNLALDKRPGFGRARRDMRELQRDMGRPDLARNLMYYRRLQGNPFYQSRNAQSDPMTGAKAAPSQNMAWNMPQFDPRIRGGVIRGTYDRPGFSSGFGSMPMEGSMEFGSPMMEQPMMQQPMMQPQMMPPSTMPQGGPAPIPEGALPHNGPILPSPGAHMPMPFSHEQNMVMQSHPMPQQHTVHSMPPMQGQYMPGQPVQMNPMQMNPMPPHGMPMNAAPMNSMPMQGMTTQPMPMHGAPMGAMPGQSFPQGMPGHQPVPSPYPPVAPGGFPQGQFPVDQSRMVPVPARHPVELGQPVPVTQMPPQVPGVSGSPTVISGVPSTNAF